MKKFWKILGITALAAAVPVRVKKDESTGKRKYQSLLLSVDVGPGEEGEGTAIGINIGEGLINSIIMNTVAAKKETVHFADDEPEAAMVEPIEMAEPDLAGTGEEEPAFAEEPEPQTVEAASEPEVTEEDFDPEL